MNQPVQRQPDYKQLSRRRDGERKEPMIGYCAVIQYSHCVGNQGVVQSSRFKKKILVIDCTYINVYKTCGTTHTTGICNSYENSIQN